VRAFVYILRCADGSFYVGSTRDSLEKRVGEHNSGEFRGYTSTRRPVTLVFHQDFDRLTDAIAAERQLKGWTRAKKEALIRGDYEALRRLAWGWTRPNRALDVASFDSAAARPAQDEVHCD
jgi:putative endonuclease